MLIQTRVDSRMLHFPINYTLTLPSEPAARKDCPVLLLLHDLGQCGDQWRELAGMDALSDCLGVALVMPEGRRSCFVNMAHGPQWNSALTEELLPDLHRVFGLREDGAGVIGLGAGALGAVMMAPHKGVTCVGLMNPRLTDAFAWDAVRWPREAEWAGVFGDGWRADALRDTCGFIAPDDKTDDGCMTVMDKTRWEICCPQDAAAGTKLETLLTALSARLKQ